MLDDFIAQLIAQNNHLNELEAQAKSTRAERNRIIKELRNSKVTARKLSDVLGISEQSIHKIVKGER